MTSARTLDPMLMAKAALAVFQLDEETPAFEELLERFRGRAIGLGVGDEYRHESLRGGGYTKRTRRQEAKNA